MTGLQIYLFGHPRVMVEQAWIEIGLRKSIALLAYLAATKQAASREAMATLLWPQAGQRTALGNLRRAIYRVNNALQADVLVATRNFVEFNQQVEAWVDIDAFESYALACLPDDQPAAVDCYASLSKAVELYTNDFLAGFTLPDCREFDEWQYFLAEDYKQKLDRMLDRLVALARDRNDWDQALYYGRRQLALNPLSDTTHYKIIELYALNDQRSAALQHYEEYRTILAEVLGVPPDESMTRMYEAIRSRQLPPASGQRAGEAHARSNGHARPASAPPSKPFAQTSQLPVQSRPFIGRTQELADLHHLLVEAANSRLITIAGLSGIGKTRLALEAATEAAHAFPDGVYFIPLASVCAADHIGAEIAERVLGPTYEGLDNEQRLLNGLRDKCMLLILDSVEHLLPMPGFLGELLHVAPKVKLLATSTDRLNLRAETVYVPEGMAYPASSSAEDFLSYGAVQLLMQYAHLTRPQIEIHPTDYAHIAHICRLVLGMPIALIQAAGWIDVLSYKEIADEIAKNIDFLRSQLQDLPDRQLSLRAVFDYSWQRLSPREQSAFMRLSVNRGGFSREAARHFAGADLPTLRALIDKSLVSVKMGAHYEIHALLRHYAEEQLLLAGELDVTRSAHSEYYLEFLGQRTANLKGYGQQTALSEIEGDFDNIRAAWDWASQSKNEVGIDRALESLFLFCDTRGRQEEGANLLRVAQESLAPEPGGRPSLVYGKVLIRLGMLESRYLRDCQAVRDTIQRGLEIVQAYGSEPDTAFGLLALAHYAADTQLDGNQALELFQKSYALFSAIGDDYYSARAVHLIGHCQLFTTGIEHFIPWGELSLNISRRIGDRANTALLLVSLAMVEFYLGNYNATESYAREALEIAKEVGHMPAWAQSNIFLGILALLRGQFTDARQYLDDGLSIARNVNFPIPLIYAEAAQAVLACLADAGDGDPVQINLDHAHQGDPYAQLFVYWASAIFHCTRHEYQAAHRCVEKIHTIDSQLGAPSIAALTLPLAAIIQSSENYPERAVELLELAEAHPLRCSGWMERWSVLAELRAGLKARLCAEEYRAARARGRQLTTNIVVVDLLPDLGDLN